MAIDVTPGSAAAVAYADAAEADAYFAARGTTTWTGDTATKEAALVRGASYLDRRYYGQWIGYRATKDQALAWPRSWTTDLDGYYIDADEVPERLKEANFEAALLTLTGTSLEPTLERGGHILSENAGAGPTQSSVTYSGAASPHDTFTSVEWALQGLLKSNELLRV